MELSEVRERNHADEASVNPDESQAHAQTDEIQQQQLQNLQTVVQEEEKHNYQSTVGSNNFEQQQSKFERIENGSIQPDLLNTVIQDIYAPLQESPDITIGITDHRIKNPDLKPKYVIYQASGRDQDGEFSVWRRYGDFRVLRELLLEAWPGCYIPPIPPKVLVNSVEWDFVNQRMRLLSSFLKKLALTKHIYSSQLVQVFLRYGGEECQKELQLLPKLSPTKIIDAYSKIFKTLQGKDVTAHVIVQLTRFNGLMTRCQSLLKSHESKLENLADIEQQHVKNVAQMADLFFPEYERALLSAYTNEDDKKYIFLQPNNKNLQALRQNMFQHAQQKELTFTFLKEFFKYEELESQAYLDMLLQRDKIEKKKYEFEKKIRSSQQIEEELRSGAIVLKSLFTSGSKEQKIELEHEKQRQLKEEFDNQQKLGDIIIAIIAFIEIEKYMQERAIRYQLLIQKTSSGQLQTIHTLVSFWSEVFQLSQNYSQNFIKQQ